MTDLHTRISAALDREQAQIPRSRTNHTDFCYYCAQSRADRRRVKADRRVPCGARAGGFRRRMDADVSAEEHQDNPASLTITGSPR